MSQLALPGKGRAVKRLVISQTLHLTRPHTQKEIIIYPSWFSSSSNYKYQSYSQFFNSKSLSLFSIETKRLL